LSNKTTMLSHHAKFVVQIIVLLIRLLGNLVNETVVMMWKWR